ncbi:hypothetical protein LSAT2_016893 [Lamellibrachia satsuma]|nr:hypothetical protein LSAT2_016893 [Lamellibrachia satsuma]
MGIPSSRPVGFAMFLAISLLTLLVEQGMTSYLAYHLYASGHLAWFALTSGLLVVSSVGIQLTSYQWQARADVGGRARCTSAVAVATHVLQCGMVWRYGRMTLSRRIAVTRRELWEMFALRTFGALANTLPQLIFQVYLLLQLLGGAVVDVPTSIVGATVAVSLTSACWALATYRKPVDYCCVIGAVSPPGAVVVMLGWRLGELTARLLTLALFASVHGYWLFLVLGLHWGSMLAMCLVDRLVLQRPPAAVADVALTSYVYVFCYLTLTSRPSRHARALYHVTAALEAGTLLLLWLVGDTALSSRHVAVALLVTGAYTTGAVLAVLYYNCFHQARPSTPPRHSTDTCLHQCINCRLSCCDKHSRKLQRPHVATWVNVLHAQAQYDLASRRVGRTRTLGRRETGGPTAPGQWGPTTDGHTAEGTADRFHEKHLRTQELMQTGPEFLWDNYDLQLPASNPGTLRVKCEPRSPGGAATTKRSPGVAVADQGYHSGISTSTKATYPSRLPWPGDDAASYVDAYGDIWDDAYGDTCGETTMSDTTYTTSCSAGPRHCNRRDQCLSTDSTSVYSVRSGTSFSSVQPDYQLRSARLKEERRRLRQARFKYGLEQQQQRATVANIRQLSYSSDPSAPSDVTSGTEYFTDGF